MNADPEKRPPGVYESGREVVFDGDAPDPKVLERLTRPRKDGSKPLVIVLGPETIEPPAEEVEVS